MTKSSRTLIVLNRRYLLLLVLLAVALYVLVPQFGDFRASWQLLRRPAPGWTAAAIGLTAVTYLAAAGTYCFLAFQSLAYGKTILVELAATFVNRLLPGGLGALGTNYAYLRRRHHSGTQAATIVGINNLLGLLGHGLILAIALVIMPGHLPAAMHGRNHATRMIIELLVGIGLVTIAAALVFGRSRFAKVVAELRHQVLSYQRRPWRLAAALTTSMLLTLSNVLSLWCCALALGVHLSFTLLLLIFSFGLGTGTATPTPGGLGGFEAGLTAGFIAYHVPGSTALAIALLYRLISYWLPLLAGAPALVISQKRRLLTL